MNASAKTNMFFRPTNVLSQNANLICHDNGKSGATVHRTTGPNNFLAEHFKQVLQAEEPTQL